MYPAAPQSTDVDPCPSLQVGALRRPSAGPRLDRAGRGARQRDLRHTRHRAGDGRTRPRCAGAAAGSVSFVPVANPLAYAHGRRAGDRNLNRALQPTDAPREFEDHVANWLCPLLAAHEVLLDLHSFHGGGQPFVMVGPRDNAGRAGAVCAGRARRSAGALPGRGPRRGRLARHLCRRRGAVGARRRGRRPRRRAGTWTHATASAPPNTCARWAAAR